MKPSRGSAVHLSSADVGLVLQRLMTIHFPDGRNGMSSRSSPDGEPSSKIVEAENLARIEKLIAEVQDLHRRADVLIGDAKRVMAESLRLREQAAARRQT